MEFKTVKLSDVVSVLGDGIHGTPKYTENGEYYFINGNNLSEGKIIIKKDTKRVDLEEYKKYKKELNDRTLLVSINGTLGNVAVYNNEKCILGKSACYFNIKENVNKEFIKYILYSKEFQKYIQEYATGTTIKNMSLKAMREYEFKLPEIKIQNKIACILSNIDKKIELNNQINDNLYKYMENLYKEWFVKYSIYKDSNYKDSELGLIPEGYEIVDIYSISNIIYGAPFKSSLFNDEKKGIPIIRIRDLKSQEFKTYTEEIHPKGYLLKYGDIAVGMDGEFKPYIWGNDEAWLNQRICVFDNKRKKGKAFLYYSLKPLLEYVESTETATTVIHIGKNDFDKFRIVLPSDNILNRFDELTNPMIEQIVNNIKENNFLTKLRDILLPKLMNGEIDLDKIEI